MIYRLGSGCRYPLKLRRIASGTLAPSENTPCKLKILCLILNSTPEAVCLPGYYPYAELLQVLYAGATNTRGTGTAFSYLPGTSVSSVNCRKLCKTSTPVPGTFGSYVRLCAQFVHSRIRMAIDPRISTMPGRNTSGFHQHGRENFSTVLGCKTAWEVTVRVVLGLLGDNRGVGEGGDGGGGLVWTEYKVFPAWRRPLTETSLRQTLISAASRM